MQYISGSLLLVVDQQQSFTVDNDFSKPVIAADNVFFSAIEALKECLLPSMDTSESIADYLKIRFQDSHSLLSHGVNGRQPLDSPSGYRSRGAGDVDMSPCGLAEGLTLFSMRSHASDAGQECMGLIERLHRARCVNLVASVY